MLPEVRFLNAVTGQSEEFPGHVVGEDGVTDGGQGLMLVGLDDLLAGVLERELLRCVPWRPCPC